MISSRDQVTQMIIAAKVRKGLKWTHAAEAIGRSKEWTTAGCLGQMAFDKPQAEALGNAVAEQLLARTGDAPEVDEARLAESLARLFAFNQQRHCPAPYPAIH